MRLGINYFYEEKSITNIEKIHNIFWNLFHKTPLNFGKKSDKIIHITPNHNASPNNPILHIDKKAIPRYEPALSDNFNKNKRNKRIIKTIILMNVNR